MTDWDHDTVRDVDWMLSLYADPSQRVKRCQSHGRTLFLYFEDVDWCYRMKKGGWRVCYLPQAEMIHHHRRESARNEQNLFFHIMSMFHFYDKWGKFLYFLRKYRVVLGVMLFVLLDLAAINLSFVGRTLFGKAS